MINHNADCKIENNFWLFNAVKCNEEIIFNLIDKNSGRKYIDENYYYALKLKGSPHKKKYCLVNSQVSEQSTEEEKCIKITGEILLDSENRSIKVVQTYSIAKDNRWFEEYITIENNSADTLELDEIHFAFKKKLNDKYDGWVDNQDEFTLTSIPTRRYRSHFADRKRDYATAHDLVYPGAGQEVPGYCDEGWLWGNNSEGLLVCKYNVTEMEYSRFESYVENFQLGISRSVNDTYIIFGGASTYKGDPELCRTLKPGQKYDFGVTRYSIYYGDWQEGYYLYREHLDEKGHGLPKNYNPPVHWNELYNLGYFSDGSSIYTREQLMGEAELARDIGAEALYVDPGWDTFPGSTIWNTERFGPLNEFSRELRDKYGLKLALHLMQNFLSDHENPAFYARDKDGKLMPVYNLHAFCANDLWVEEKSKRLIELAGKGVDFFMFDFPEYTGCCSTEHNHEIPLSKHTHVSNVFKVVQNVKEQYPDILIEAHDRITGGVTGHHAMYFQHGLPHCHDENWGYEYMWNPMLDLLSKRALSLYEYNLAYSIPLYLHINERVDNRNMLQFWWYASVVRHLGIGGVDRDDLNYEPLKAAMSLYGKLKPYFTLGRFYGIDYMAHLHIRRDVGSSVLTCFNINSRDECRKIAIDCKKYGIEVRNITAVNGLGENVPFEFTLSDDKLELNFIVKALSPVIIILS